MKFHTFERKTKNKIFKIKPVEYFENIYKRLDFLLGYIKNNENKFKDYVNRLIDDFQCLIKISSAGDYKIDNLSKYNNLKSNMELVRLHGDLMRQELGISMEQANSIDEIEIPSRYYWRGIILPRYYQLVALIKILGRYEAIKLFKDYVDQYYIYIKSTFEHYDSLDEFYNKRIGDKRKSTDNEFAVVYSTVENGVYIIRIDNCPAVESLDGIDDKELIYTIMCYPDYQHAKIINENFLMTRNSTIAEGGPYCDKVFHDTRIDKDLKHFSNEFFDSMSSN